MVPHVEVVKVNVFGGKRVILKNGIGDKASRIVEV